MGLKPEVKEAYTTAMSNLENAGLFDNNEKETMLQRVFGKVQALEDIRIPDPFISSMVYGSNKMKNMFDSQFELMTASKQKLNYLFFSVKIFI